MKTSEIQKRAEKQKEQELKEDDGLDLFADDEEIGELDPELAEKVEAKSEPEPPAKPKKVTKPKKKAKKAAKGKTPAKPKAKKGKQLLIKNGPDSQNGFKWTAEKKDQLMDLADDLEEGVTPRALGRKMNMTTIVHYALKSVLEIPVKDVQKAMAKEFEPGGCLVFERGSLTNTGYIGYRADAMLLDMTRKLSKQLYKKATENRTRWREKANLIRFAIEQVLTMDVNELRDILIEEIKAVENAGG